MRGSAATRRRFRRFLPVLACCALGLTAATTARAGLLGPDCGDRPVSQPFLRWLDPGHYFLAPGGSFESGASGWTLTGGAGVASGNEPFLVNSPTDRSSLVLPAGSTATTPSFCVSASQPTLRLFAAAPGSLLSTLQVEAEVTTLGITTTLPVGVAHGLVAGWSPTLPMVFSLSLDQLLTTSTVRFRFRPLLTPSGSSWRIDDVYVDPFKDR